MAHSTLRQTCAVAILITSVGILPVTIHAAPICSGLSSQARHSCLIKEQRRQEAEAARQNRKAERLDRAFRAACVADTVAGAAAGRAAGLAGAGVYKGTRAAGNKLSGGKSSCTPRAE